MTAAEAAAKVYTRDELRTMIVPLVDKHGLKGAWLFGSYARNEATPASDIDVLVEGGQGFRPLSVFSLADDLCELSGKKVDIFEVSELDDGSFRDTVLQEAVIL